MALVVESTSTAIANDAAAVTITKPTGVAVGDLLLLISSAQTCTGFTEILSSTLASADVRLLYRIADASDVSASNYTVNGTSNTEGAAAMLRVSGWVSGNPIFASGTASGSHDGTLVIAETVSFSRPTQQLLLMFGRSNSDDNYVDFGTFQITSSDSNPSWTKLGELDFTTVSGADENSLFVAYATSTDTSTITQWGLTTGNDISGGADSSAFGFAVICSPANATGTNATFAVSPTIFTNAGVEVGTTGTNATFAVSPEMFDQSGRAEQKTVWVNETKPTTTWTNETL